MITREEAIKFLIKPVATSTKIGEEKQKEFEAYNMAIEALNTKVVRCKDCRHYLIDGFTSTTGWCYEIKNSVYEDDYCSYGERREE